MKFDEREFIYGQDEYYWGTTPNQLAKNTVELLPEQVDEVSVIDIGAGEGRDAVYFAEHGWDVCAMDISPNGLEKAERLAANRDVDIDTLEADINSVRLPEGIDVVYSVGAIQYIRPENRTEQFEHFKQQTNSGGIHVMFSFTDHPEIPTPPDWTENEYFYSRGEVEEYYHDWEIIETQEIVFDDDSGDEPHKHAAEVVIAKKPNTTK